MGTPAVASAPQVPADSHGRQLRNLGRQRWYLPAVTVANAAGFEGSGAVAALNKWIGKLKRNDAIPRDVEEYNVYPVDSRAEYYISGDEKLNSSTSIGIGFTLYEQKLAFSHLEQPQYRGMLKYGMGENDAALPADKDGWMALIVPLCCGYNDIFYLDTAPAVGASTAAAPRRRRAATQVAQTLKQMQACGALDLTDTQPVAPSRDHTKPDLPEAPPTSAPHAEPTAPSASAQQAPEIQMVPRIINFHSKEYKISKNGNEDRAYDDRTRIAVLRMKQSDVSDYEAPGLLVDILTLYGHVIEGEAPSRKFCSNMTPEGGVLAFCLIAQQLLDWGRDDEAVDVVTAEGDQGKQYAGQRVTASADGASIGEDKFIAVAMQKQVEVTHKGAIQKVFRRVALPLIHLPEGSDERKQQALLDSMDDVVGSYNAICAEETGEDMSQYDIAKLIGYCCNDHAESVVANKFAPAIKKIMELVNGTKGEVLAVQLLLKADFTAPKPVVLQPYRYGHPLRGAFIEPDGRPAGYTHNKREFQRIGQRKVSLPPDARLLVPQTIYSPEVIDIHRGRGVSKVMDNLMFCNRHKLAVTLDGGMAALNAAEAQVGSVLANQAAAEAATQRPTRYQISGSKAQTAVRTTSFVLGKPKKVSETLSHGTLHRCIKQAVQSADDHPRFRAIRLLGSRGQTGVMANAIFTLCELIDTGDWGATGWADAADAKSKSSNDAHTGLRNFSDSDLVQAELRVWGILYSGLVHPLESYIQNNTTQRDMVSTQKEYAAVLRKLMAVTTLSMAADGTDAHLPELPWCPGRPGELHSAAATVSFAKKVATAQKAMKVLVNPPIPQERNAAQLPLMVAVLQHMAGGMLKKLEGLMDARYGGLFSMTEEELDASETHLIPATSDAIERYFGLASWLDSRNPNLTRQNHSYRVSMKETKVGSKLCELYRANPDRVSRMMYRGRHFALEFDNLMVTRKEQVLEERIAGYDNARLAKKKKDDTSAAELEKMRGEARKWTHRELTHRTGRQTNSVLAAGRTAVPTVTSLVAETRAARDGTDIQNNTAVEKMLVRWLTVFHKVHGLSEVPALQSIFYSRTSGHLCIKGDGAGGQKSELQLMENLAACSAYLKENGGADLFTDEPGQATGPSGGSEAPAGP